MRSLTARVLLTLVLAGGFLAGTAGCGGRSSGDDSADLGADENVDLGADANADLDVADNAGGTADIGADPGLDVVEVDGPATPASCAVDADCEIEGACPPDAALGCACAPDPQGQKRCVPSCGTDTDCPQPPDQVLVCTDGLCAPDGGGGPGPGPGSGMTTENSVSDQAQAATIAFDGLAFVTGSFCAQTFYPPGKVADFFGFQYLRDNDPTNLGHNTEFTTLTADPVLALLTDAQLDVLADLGDVDQGLAEQYALARLPLALAFRRLFDGDTPDGHPDLDPDAVKAYSGWLFGIDGQMSFLRAQAYAKVLASMTAEQKAKLLLVKDGASSEGWAALQPSDPGAVGALLQQHPSKGDLRTFAGEMLAWYVGGTDPDVYFCPERQGTYFGSFFMKDVKAMHNPDTTIDSNLTAEMGQFFLDTLDVDTQRPRVEGLVTTQKADLTDIVSTRTLLSDALRGFLVGVAVDQAEVLDLAGRYGALDGELSALYATAFSSLELRSDQQAALVAERKKATAEEDGSADYDLMCGNGYLYSAPLPSPPTVRDTDFLFGVCVGVDEPCSDAWDCCSFSCVSGACRPKP